MLIYSICYYYGKNKKSNIKNHLSQFMKVKTEQKEFVVTAMIDSHDEKTFNKVINDLSTFIEMVNKDIKYKIIPSFNWGGTILGLWLTYKYCKDHYDIHSETYIAHFEEDFGPYNKKWLEDSIKLLKNDYIYIGETTINRIKTKNDDSRIKAKLFRNSIRLGNPEVWTDGGYYFSNLLNLEKIKNRIGIFHKGDNNTKWDHIRDGIDIGEVGFPTLLYHNGFKFNYLHRKKYFLNEW